MAELQSSSDRNVRYVVALDIADAETEFFEFFDSERWYLSLKDAKDELQSRAEEREDLPDYSIFALSVSFKEVARVAAVSTVIKWEDLGNKQEPKKPKSKKKLKKT